MSLEILPVHNNKSQHFIFKNMDTSTSKPKILMNSIFTSKANVLHFLEKKITKSLIENSFDFTVKDWKENKEKILKRISEQFRDKKIIIRSSAIGEDSQEKSEAGNYQSVPNVDPSSKLIVGEAVDAVIKSYYNKGNQNFENQILVQSQSTDIIKSGVIFSRTESLGEPYFVINYEEGSSTDGITQGRQGELIKIFREMQFTNIPKIWQPLILAIQEIEVICKTNSVDIEFGITKDNKVIIFQVRPITTIKKTSFEADKEVKKQILNCKKKYLRLNQKLDIVKTAIFSDMTDWNPAEIIGDNPNLLDFSLYDYLIMKDIWHKGREKIGYNKFPSYPLMVRFGNKPYVDIFGSFYSLIPERIPKKIQKKLIRYYFYKLIQNPELHDKVEFDILFTSFDLDIDSRLKELKFHNFTKEEIIKIKEILIEFTNRIIENFPDFQQESIKYLEEMSVRREKFEETLKGKKNPQDLLLIAKKLLNDCRKFGTLPFSSMARIAFIGSILLRSSVKKGLISQKSADYFMRSIETPLTEFQNDLFLFMTKKISKSNMIKKYGHLRPGTYDITANRYDKEKLFFEKLEAFKAKKDLGRLEKLDLAKDFSKFGLRFKSINFEDFIRESLTYREILKFEFTKNLSDALESISEAGKLMGFSRKDLSYLDLSLIINSYKIKSKTKIKILWESKIKKQKIKKRINDGLVLPSLIFSPEDFEIIKYHSVLPNFITTKSISANIIELKNQRKPLDIKNKIILLENADPGYDWIFSKKPEGLITKYGGVASHMAIRCAEIGLPAAIGCGEILFEKLQISSKVLLDCKNKQVIILEHQSDDEELEVKKTLKTLGYIK